MLRGQGVHDAYTSVGLQLTGRAAGEPISAEFEKSTRFLEQPNRYQFFVSMLEDPKRLLDYVEANCSTSLVQGDDSQLFLQYLEPEQLSKIDFASGGRMIQCVDNFGALERVSR